MYGTRDAALNWHQRYTEHLTTVDFNQGNISPCLFYHVNKGIIIVMHGGDYVPSGRASQFKRFENEFARACECKVQVPGFEPNDEMPVKIINRILSYVQGEDDDAIAYEVDPRHAEILVKELKVQDAKPWVSPMVRCDANDYQKEKDEEAVSAPEDITRYKSRVARANNFALDRPDVLFACRTLSMKMSSRCGADWQQFGIVAEHTQGCPRSVHTYRPTSNMDLVCPPIGRAIGEAEQARRAAQCP